MRTSYPYASWWLDLLMAQEVQEQEGVLEPARSQEAAKEHRKEVQEMVSPFKEDLRSGMVEMKEDNK